MTATPPRTSDAGAGTPLASRVERIEGYQAICQLQGRYCQYIGLGMGEEIAALFADHPEVEVEIAESGVFKGADAPIRYFGNLSKSINRPGFLTIHMGVSPVIELSADGMRAEAVWISPGLLTSPRPDGDIVCDWQYGRYVTQCIRQDDVWRFLTFRWYRTFQTPYETNWATSWESNTRGRNPNLPAADGPTTLHAPYRPDAVVRTLPAPPVPAGGPVR